MTEAPAPPSVPADLQPWKGAWGGAWTTFYGALVVLEAVLTVASLDLLLQLCRLGAAAMRANQPHGADAEPGIDRLAELVSQAPAAFGESLRTWTWIGGAFGVVAIVAGLGTLRRSRTMRAVAVAAIVLSLATSLATAVRWLLEVLPVYETWIGAFGETWEDLASQARQGGQQPPDLDALFRFDRAQQIATTAFAEALHVAVAVPILARLLGRHTRAWCEGATAAR